MRTSEASTEPPSRSIDGALACRVLGPLEVWKGGSLLPVGGPQERALLALLLTAPGRVFSVPTIVAGLWGENHPRGAEKTVQSYVSRLRRTLPTDVAAMVQTRRPGYLVSLDPERVDAEVFGSLVATGRREPVSARRRGLSRQQSSMNSATLSLLIR
jgi:DNA-binding SARP family transcriptional activator